MIGPPHRVWNRERRMSWRGKEVMLHKGAATAFLARTDRTDVVPDTSASTSANELDTRPPLVSMPRGGKSPKSADRFWLGRADRSRCPSRSTGVGEALLRDGGLPARSVHRIFRGDLAIAAASRGSPPGCISGP